MENAGQTGSEDFEVRLLWGNTKNPKLQCKFLNENEPNKIHYSAHFLCDADLVYGDY